MRHFIFSIFLSILVLGVKAQDMAGIFAAMPDQKIPQLEHAWRKDLIDLFTAGKKAKLKNTMGGYSTLQKLTPDYLLLQPTERSTVEMKRLPLVNNTYIVCVVTTVKGPVADSRVEFFTTEWQPLAAEDLFTPVAAGWFLKEDTNPDDPAYQDAVSRLDMDLIQYTLSPEEETLTATYTTPSYVEYEEREKVLQFIKPEPKVYRWEKSHFK